MSITSCKDMCTWSETMRCIGEDKLNRAQSSPKCNRLTLWAHSETHPGARCAGKIVCLKKRHGYRAVLYVCAVCLVGNCGDGHCSALGWRWVRGEGRGHLQCTPPSHCCQGLRKIRRWLGMGQTPAGPSSMNSRVEVKLNGVWFVFCAKSIRRIELYCIVWWIVRVWYRLSHVDAFKCV
jgi:hypothetical protein